MHMLSFGGQARKRNHGFTVVELLIVIVVIAILVAITVVSYFSIQERARFAVVQTELRNVGQSMAIISLERDITEADWKTVLDNTGLYEPTRKSTEKSFIFCWSGSNFSILAMRPLVDSSQAIPDGTEVWVYRRGGVSSIAWRSAAVGSQTQTKACNQVLPDSYSQWSSFI